MNVGLAIFDDDRTNGPINDVRYNGNQFYPGVGFNNLLYWDNLAPVQSGGGLNKLVVNRQNGTVTDKSPNGGNIDLSSMPNIGAILAAPSVVLPLVARGESETTTHAFLGYAWSGRAATLDGVALSSFSGIKMVAEEGLYNLSVSGSDSTAMVSQGASPKVSFTSTILSDNTIQLNWETEAGSWLDTALDGCEAITPARSGSVMVNQNATGYYLYVVTQEGGVVMSLEGAISALYTSSEVNKIIGLNNPSENFGYIYLVNLGNIPLNWTASTRTPNLLDLEPTSGILETTSSIRYEVNHDGLSPGDYQGIIEIDAGSAGRSTVVVNITVVNELNELFISLVVR